MTKARGQKGWAGEKGIHITQDRALGQEKKREEEVSTYQEDDHNADLLRDGGGPQENRQELGPGDASCAYGSECYVRNE
jgi:hypothetical protein